MNLNLPLPSLKELCLIKTSICLWSTESVVEDILNKCIPGSTNSKSKDKWEALNDLVIRNISEVPIPNYLRTELRVQLFPIASELEKWLKKTFPLRRDTSNFIQSVRRRNVAHYFRHLSWTRVQNLIRNSSINRFYLTCLSWNCLGIIEHRQIARIIVQYSRVKVGDRYCKAVRFCLVDDAYELSRQWTKNPLSDFTERYRNDLYYGEEFAVKYFWPTLSEVEQEVAFDLIKPFDKYVSTETVRFVLSRMTLSDQLNYLEKGAYGRLLDWPYHHLFLQLTTDNLELLSPKTLYCGLDFLWDSVQFNKNLVHKRLLKCYLSIVPEQVIMLYAAVKEALLLFLYFNHVNLEVVFETVEEDDFEFDCQLENASLLSECPSNYPNVDCKRGVREIRAFLRRYRSLLGSDMSDMECSVNLCLKALFKEHTRRWKNWCANGDSNKRNSVRRCGLTLCNYLESLT